VIFCHPYLCLHPSPPHLFATSYPSLPPPGTENICVFRSSRVCERLALLEPAVRALDPKTASQARLDVAARITPTRLFGSIEADHFLRASCPDAILSQYLGAERTPVPLLRECDNFRSEDLLILIGLIWL
jgi:hypothetical protein